MADMESKERSFPSTSREPKPDRKAAMQGLSIWNPLQGLKTKSDALEAAKAGAVVAGIIAIEHVVAGFSVAASARADTADVLGNLIAILLMAFLGWRIFKDQKLWASVAIMVWAVVEVVAKLIFMLNPKLPGLAHVSSLLISFIVLAGAILSVRGCLQIKRLEAEKSP
jgi:hypothetical protein